MSRFLSTLTDCITSASPAALFFLQQKITCASCLLPAATGAAGRAFFLTIGPASNCVLRQYPLGINLLAPLSGTVRISKVHPAARDANPSCSSDIRHSPQNSGGYARSFLETNVTWGKHQPDWPRFANPISFFRRVRDIFRPDRLARCGRIVCHKVPTSLS